MADEAKYPRCDCGAVLFQIRDGKAWQCRESKCRRVFEPHEVDSLESVMQRIGGATGESEAAA